MIVPISPAVARTLHAVAVVAALVVAPWALAADPQPKPFAAGNAVAGKPMFDKDCVLCHARKFDGKPDQMYLRADHRVRTSAQLLTQVQYCNSQLATGYFPEEEEHVAAYLNLHYYKFAP
jgi:cytochrome c5